MKRLLTLVALLLTATGTAQSFGMPHGEIFRTAPYLQNPSPTAVTVMWHTTVPCHSWVEYGIDSTKMTRAVDMIEGEAVANTTHNRVRLAELQPGTTYYYRVCSRRITLYEPYRHEFGATEQSQTATFTTFDDSATDFTALIFNDIHDNKPLFDKLNALVANTPRDVIFFNGDCIPDVQTEDIALAAIDYYCLGVGGNRVPCIFMRGNHETRGAYSPFLWTCWSVRADARLGLSTWATRALCCLTAARTSPTTTLCTRV